MSDSMVVAIATVASVLIQATAITLQLWIRAHYRFTNGHHKEDDKKKSDQ